MTEAPSAQPGSEPTGAPWSYGGATGSSSAFRACRTDRPIGVKLARGRPASAREIGTKQSAHPTTEKRKFFGKGDADWEADQVVDGRAVSSLVGDLLRFA
jgi:hypothetical protein